MFDRTLKLIKDKVLSRQYVMTIHADEEKDADGLTILDIENCILTGRIIERQKDRLTGEWKYKISGESKSGKPVELITKISPTGKLVIITVYLIKR